MVTQDLSYSSLSSMNH